METEDSLSPYRGFLRSGSYPALGQRVRRGGGVVARAAAWFALVVTAASAGYNMTQRLVASPVSPLAVDAPNGAGHRSPRPESHRFLGPSLAAAEARVPEAPLVPAATVSHSSGRTQLRGAADPASQRRGGGATTAAAPSSKGAAPRRRSGAAARPEVASAAATSAAATALAGMDDELERLMTARTEQSAEREKALDLLARAQSASGDRVPGGTRRLARRPAPEPSAEAQLSRAVAVAVALDEHTSPQRSRLTQAAAVPATAEERAAVLPLTAAANIQALKVRGPLSVAYVRRGLERVRPTLSECYADAAQRAGRNDFRQVHVSLTIDEAGRVKRRPKVEGAALPGFGSCLSSALSKIVCRAPDTGIARASITLRFEP